VGGGIAYGIASVLPRRTFRDISVPLLAGIVGTVVANLEFAFLAIGRRNARRRQCNVRSRRRRGHHGHQSRSASEPSLRSSFAGTSGAIRPAVCASSLLSLGALVAFSAGASQVGLAVGPLFPLLEELPTVSPIAVLLGGGVGILVGSWTVRPE